MTSPDIARWLLEGGSQRRDGQHAGAVAGALTSSGEVQYVYPEITGYYLQWLAWRAADDGRTLALEEAAAAAQRWLTAWITGPRPPTRVYLHTAERDWRNEATFTFDLAMVLRGLASAHRVGLVVADPQLVEQISSALQTLAAPDGQFEPCLTHDPKARLPERWSTRQGAFLAKAAAGVIAARASLPTISRELERVAEATFTASIGKLVSDPHTETHPLLYAFEGLLALPNRHDFAANLTAAAPHFRALMHEYLSCGRLSESRGGHGVLRTDVVAQALRVGLLLRAHRDDLALDARSETTLASSLRERIDPTGALPFAFDATTLQFNTWTTMFADQALALASSSRADVIAFAHAPCIV